MLTPPSMKVRPWLRGMLWGVLAWGWLTIGFWFEAVLPMFGGPVCALWMFMGAGGVAWHMVDCFMTSERANKC